MADELADQGYASEEEPVLPGQQKYGSLIIPATPRPDVNAQSTRR